jgi:hypothetical protein
MRTSSALIQMLVRTMSLQSGVGVRLGEEVGVGVSVAVEVVVLVGVSEGMGVSLGTGVSVGMGDGVGVKVGRERVAGRPTTRAVRNCSTMPSRLAVRWIIGHQELRMGTINGWSKSTVTLTRSPGPPASSRGVQSAERAFGGSGST